MNKDWELIQGIKSGDNRILKEFYEGNRQAFYFFLNKYSIHEEDIMDIYQDSIIALCDQIKKGKLDNLQSSLKTYLFSIGKFKLYAFLKKNNVNHSLELDLHQDWVYEEEEIKLEENVIELSKAFEKLGKVCQQVLKLFYYEGKKLDEIVQLLGYENKDVLKSQKSRCLKQLKTLVGPKK